MKELILPRVYLPTETLGSIYDGDVLICKTMEQAWRNNQKDNPNTPENDASCIPEASYIVEKQGPSFGRDYGYFRFRAIAGRTINKWAIDKEGNAMSSILIHPITYVQDLLGCIGVGSRFADLNGDGVLDMAESKRKLQWMYENLPDIFKLTIKKK